MRVEIPTCKRCFCLPLRHGIIISGYINLISSLMIVGLEIALSIKYMASDKHMVVYKGVAFYSQVWLTSILYFTEIIFSLILIVGAHMKRMAMIRAFYYYSITTTLAVLVIFLVVRQDDYYKDWGHYIFEFSLAFCAFVFQLYLLLLIRSELMKTKERSQLRIVNQMSEIIINSPISEGRNPL